MLLSSQADQFNPAQREVLEHGLLSSGFSCILQMPTGSGKTWLSRTAIKQTIKQGRRAIYLTPLRALAEELSGRWRAELGEDKVGIFTGDYGRTGREYPLAYKDAHVLIMTPERLDACTRVWRSHWDWIPEVDLVVVDEIHLLGDSGRGARLEGTISRLGRLNPFCRFLGLSATLGNRGELADWLQGVEYESTWRPVPLNWRVTRYRKADEKPGLLAREIMEVRGKGGQSLVFVQSRRRAESLSRYLSEQGIRSEYHHAGLGHANRKTAEDAFRSNRTEALVATATLEMGLNLPARQVVLYDLQAFDGSMFSPLATNTVWQRAGRAGRPGLDKEGEVVLMAPTWDREVQRYASGRFERIESGLSDPTALAEQILVEVHAGFARSSVQLERAFAGSLAAHQKHTLNIEGSVSEMVKAGMLRFDQDEEELLGEETLVATPLGRVATRHLLRPETILKLREFLKRQPQRTWFDILVSAACTDDCEPVIAVDFEELDELGRILSEHRSFLFGHSPRHGADLLDRSGKRLLSAMKTAVILLDWTNIGDAEQVAREHGCYPFEVLRLQESMDRLLVAMAGVQRLLDGVDAGNKAGSEKEKSEEVRRIELLRQMIANGLNERAASLTLVKGIGAKWARKLIASGIEDLEKLAACLVSELVALGGISEERARKWIETARDTDLRISQFVSPSLETPQIQTMASEWQGSVDPYRLRRALELRVEQKEPGSWVVVGGLEPHVVLNSGTKLTCDCPDHAKGHACKHLLAVQLACGDSSLRAAVDQVRGEKPGDYMNVFELWFDAKGGSV
jgi:helicase